MNFMAIYVTHLLLVCFLLSLGRYLMSGETYWVYVMGWYRQVLQQVSTAACAMLGPMGLDQVRFLG
jgi:hypothetical protein